MFALGGRSAACIRGLLGYDFNGGGGRYENQRKIEQARKRQRERREKKKLMTARQTETESEKGSEKREIGAIIQLAAGAEGILSCHRSQPCRRGSKLFYCTLASVCVCAAPSYCLVAAYLV